MVSLMNRNFPLFDSLLSQVSEMKPVGERCLQGILWCSPPPSMTSHLALMTFKMAIKVFIGETDKNFDFITEILFQFLGFGDFKVSIVIES